MGAPKHHKGTFPKEHEFVVPLDYLIMESLPDEGALFAGVYPEGMTVKQIAREKFEDKIKGTLIGPRMTSLQVAKFVVAVKVVGAGGAQGYQLTPAGKEALAKWKETQNG